MREVKEIRLGKYSKNFDKWPEESKKHDSMRCFVIFYGSEFKLKVFSVAGKRQNYFINCSKINFTVLPLGGQTYILPWVLKKDSKVIISQLLHVWDLEAYGQ